ncbi:MAG: discoidin domain-containing protein, partial [Candidatus Latescibacteria bacterium]|nr:discoidin domain-containing protein [Candidatus Latescibacterota bacterium]
MFSMFRKLICLVSFVVVLGLVLPSVASAADEMIWREAESADTITLPLKIYPDDEGADPAQSPAQSGVPSGGKYIGTDKGTAKADPPADGIATYTFTVKGGTYKMLGRVTIPDAGSDAFWIRIPGWSSPQVTRDDDWVKWNWIDMGGTWHWDEVHNEELSGDPIVHFTLSAGKHALKIAYREGGALIDGFLITDNLALDQASLPDQIPFVPVPKASNPNPADEATDVPRDVALSWMPGMYADKHDVYFGTNFDDVNDATTTVDPASVYMGRQDPDYYPVSGALNLDLGQTYYWRINEVNAPPDSTIFEGDVWQFTVEPIAYPIAGELIIATASSSNSAGEGPENTINGSGLDENDLHSAEQTDMWLSSITGPQPTWIQYEFDKVYKLHQMLVWNHNSLFEPMTGFGLKDATIEYSVDGSDYTQLDTTHEFARAPGAAGYASNTTVDFGVAAKYVKITANSNWGGIVTQYGLSEVRFSYIPVWAREPDPASGTTDMDVDNVTLIWRAGREAASHEVYLSTDEQEVIDETISPVSVPGGSSYASYDTGELELGTTYYWKVNEVNEAETPTTWQGDISSFSTEEYLVVETFEDYNDISPDRIFETWRDGLGYTGHPGNGSGSIVGYIRPPYAEQSIVHGDKQSMPLFYDNCTCTAGYSETTVNVGNLAIGQDWTKY